MVILCPHCAFPILPRVKQQIYDYIVQNPDCSGGEIMSAVYNGVRHPSTINTHLSQMRPVLESRGLEVVCIRRRHHYSYQIVEIKVPANASV